MNNILSQSFKNVIVIVPAYNESRSIQRIVKSIVSQKIVSSCLIIDDGSTDTTAVLAKRSGAVVISLAKNRGSGFAIQIGLKYAIEKMADAVIVMDADGQHDPRDIPILLNKLSQKNAYIIASRYVLPTTSVTQKIRIIATKLIAHLFWYLLNIKVSDPTSGYRAMNAKAIRILTRNYPSIFPEPEILIMLHAEKISFLEVSVQMYPRAYGSSTITPFKGIYLTVFICLKIIQFFLTTRVLKLSSGKKY